ncbi:MAG TPA: ATP-binding protein [Chloroflexota bacterium]|nr:ATP-binding protein [Chloroflexota bacterium]
MVRTELDAGRARRAARDLAAGSGLTTPDAECVALAVSELAMNLVRYAPGGAVTLTAIEDPRAAPPRRGVRVVCLDAGPGIPDVGAALSNGFTTGGGLGGGLGAVRRLMDTFDLRSSSAGTAITAVKWERPAA